jgi:hypothetical protein
MPVQDDHLLRRCSLADVVRLMGVPEMIKKIKDIQKQFPDRVVKALRMEGEIEVTEAKKRTPVYVGPTGPGKPIPGLLRASVHLEGPFREGTRIYAKIVAGGAAGAYAIPQHENLEFFHHVGQAKYIESVIMESRPYMAARLAARIRKIR